MFDHKNIIEISSILDQNSKLIKSMANERSRAPGRYNLALLIANDHYAKFENRLPDFTQGLYRLRSTLENMQFQVEVHRNIESDMISVVKTFSEEVKDGKLLLFYFFGHAYPVDGRTYFLPIKDKQIESELDVKNLGIDAERVIRQMAGERSSCQVIAILDCCRPYLLKDDARSPGKLSDFIVTSSIHPRFSFDAGLPPMNAPSGTFIQFSAAANETTSSNLFTQELIGQLGERDVDVRDLFRRIFDTVYESSHGRQRPFSMDKLPRGGHIYLDEVYRPTECPLKPINQNQRKEVLEKQSKLREHFDNFPTIEEVADENNPDVRKAQHLTETILAQRPTGDPKDRNTACHVLSRLLGGENQQVLFFNSKEGMNLPDASANLVDVTADERPFVLTLNSNAGLGDENYKREADFDLRLAHTLNQVVRDGQSHPVLDDVRQRLATAHQVDKKQVIIEDIYLGSFNIAYTIHENKSDTIAKLPSIPKYLKRLFPEYKTVRVHPLLCRPCFDIADFDARGDRTFDGSTTFPIGPPERTRVYEQPNGWIRYGLKVLDRFADNTWLHPFQDPGNWYRAYHGTRNAAQEDFGKPGIGGDDRNYASVDAMLNIGKGGFRPARIAAYGAGVYCSPHPKFIENNYAATVSIDTQDGRKTYKCMLQVATFPYGVNEATSDIWVVPKPEHIRAYGILIKDVSVESPPSIRSPASSAPPTPVFIVRPTSSHSLYTFVRIESSWLSFSISLPPHLDAIIYSLFDLLLCVLPIREATKLLQ